MAPIDPGHFSAEERTIAYIRARQRLNQAALDDGPAGVADYLDPAYVRRAHTDLMSDAIVDAFNGIDPNVIITCPPQAGKTWTAIIWAAFWWLAKNPTTRVVIVSYNNNLAQDRGKDIRRRIVAYGNRYGLTLERGSASYQDFKLETGGGVLSVGLGGGITGNPADLLLVDDLVKNWKEAASRVYQHDAFNALGSDIFTRLAPDAPVIYTTTLWHPSDPVGRLVDRDGLSSDGGTWRLIKMPALATDLDDPLGRQPGDPLPHPRLPEDDPDKALIHWTNRAQRMNPRQWAALGQCDPQPPGGALISAERIAEHRHIPPATTPKVTFVVVDPTVWEVGDESESQVGLGRADCGILGGFFGRDGRIYITHDRTDIMPVEIWPSRAMALAVEIGASTILVEGNQGGGALTKLLVTAFEQAKKTGLITGAAPKITVKPAVGAKGDRAIHVSNLIYADKLVTGALLPQYESEWSTWQPSDARAADSPGRIDCAALAALHFLPDHASPQFAPATPAESPLLHSPTVNPYPWRNP